ncbi:MAG: peptide chain release factor N(5)-glutamine methyltransferase, partial [Candidatus Eremiobacteraeota bacterium]|nr:peptide chain release factor N(5)-glutamine methyltransferase [Candidatus Eremiobacteraeota bacterium]
MNEGVRALPGSDAGLDARRLLGFVLSRRSEWLLAHSDEPVGDVHARSFRRLCSERARGKPLAYIVGAAGFYGREFAVTDAVLVPRPETEHLVEEAIARLRQLEVGGAAPSLHVLDVGTGSGAIACSIAAEVPRALVDATDTSAHALAIATENARRIGVADRCRFFQADIMPPVTRVRFDVIVANLPYIPSADIPAKPHALGFEPRAALDGGPDGLDAY